jgi:uncharacterized protein (DUF433 family)
VNEQGTAFSVGSVVKHRSPFPEWIGVTGVVQRMSAHYPGVAFVRWANRTGENCENIRDLEVIAPPDRAPERVLAPGIAIVPGVCGGEPVIAATRIAVRSATRDWPESSIAEISMALDCPQDDIRCAVLFQAGVRWAKERRKEKRKERKDA